MTWNEFLQSLKSGALESVYVFAGAEEWLKREALNTLRGKLLPPGLEALNDLTLEGVTARQIIDAAETLPMMCEKRIVVVRDWAPLMPGKSKNEESETEQLQSWLENPPQSCVTVFYMRTEPDGRKKATALLKKKAAWVSFDPLSDADLKRWSARQLRQYDKQISPQALNTLAFMAGRDLNRLSGELSKLAAYVETRPEIAEDDVREIVSPSLEYNVFELLNRLLEGNLGEAEKMVTNLLQNGQNPVGILAMLTRQLRQLTHMRYALDAGQPVQRVQELLKMHPYAAKQTARQCKSRSGDALKALYEACVAADYDVKSGRLRDSAALSAILLKIAEGKLASRRNS